MAFKRGSTTRGKQVCITITRTGCRTSYTAGRWVAEARQHRLIKKGFLHHLAHSNALFGASGSLPLEIGRVALISGSFQYIVHLQSVLWCFRATPWNSASEGERESSFRFQSQGRGDELCKKKKMWVRVRARRARLRFGGRRSRTFETLCHDEDLKPCAYT